MSIHEALRDITIVTFDSSALIAYAENYPQSIASLTVLLNRVISGQIRSCSRVLLFPEILNFARTDVTNAEVTESRYRNLLNIVRPLFPVTEEVAEKASEFRRDFGLKTADAVHLATAVLEGSQAFATCDSDFQRVQGAIPLGNTGRTLRILMMYQL